MGKEIDEINGGSTGSDSIEFNLTYGLHCGLCPNPLFPLVDPKRFWGSFTKANFARSFRRARTSSRQISTNG
jgi:hypothetical protein